MCLGVKDRLNRETALLFDQCVVNNILEIEAKWSTIQQKAINTKTMLEIY